MNTNGTRALRDKNRERRDARRSRIANEVYLTAEVPAEAPAAPQSAWADC